MGLSSLQLEAFVEVAKAGTFSQAAKNLHLTQSALSQRIINLESELESSLIIRDPAGLRLTSAGEDLLRYCRAKAGLERELLGRITQKVELNGTIRIAGFSSVMRSAVLPVVADFIKINPDVRIEFFSREIRELMPLLARNEVDFIITTSPSQKQDIELHELGAEVNVLVQRKNGKSINNIYLDHDSEDDTTFAFLKLQGKSLRAIERHYLDEVYAIIDGVALGLGQAVLPKHLVQNDKRLEIVTGLKPLKTPLTLQFYKQPFYSRLHREITGFLIKKIPDVLI